MTILNKCDKIYLYSNITYMSFMLLVHREKQVKSFKEEAQTALFYHYFTIILLMWRIG